MQRHVFTYLLLTLITLVSNAHAKWEEIGRTPSSIFYVDPSTIERTGDLASIFQLEDFNKVEKISGVDVRATISHYQFNCSNEQYRTLRFYFFSGPMGSGYQLFKSEKVDGWSTVAGPSLMSRKVACGLLVKEKK